MIIKNNAFIKDIIWSSLALIVMNGVLQIVLYPFLNWIYGIDEYGNILYLMGMINIIATSVGASANNSRLKYSREQNRKSDYNLLIIILFLVYIPIVGIIIQFCGETMTVQDKVLYWALLCAMTYRNYGDVEYRISLNYKKYFFYYLSASVG